MRENYLGSIEMWVRNHWKAGLLAFGIVSVIVISLLFTVLSFHQQPVNHVGIGSLIVLATTLIVLMIYAYDTRRIANLQERFYLTPNVVNHVTATDEGNDSFDIGFDLINHSSFYVETTVNITLKCYDDEIHLPNEVYHGAHPWSLPPHGYLHGHFKLNNDVLSQANHTISELRQREEDPLMLTLRSNIECTSDHGIPLRIPEVKYHFVFDRTRPDGGRWSGWVLDI
jgi:hypothetical protein